MRKIITAILLTGILIICCGMAAGAETDPVTMEELEAFAGQIRQMALDRKSVV